MDWQTDGGNWKRAKFKYANICFRENVWNELEAFYVALTDDIQMELFQRVEIMAYISAIICFGDISNIKNWFSSSVYASVRNAAI